MLPVALAAATLAGCPLFPASFPTNQRVDALPVAADSDAIVRSIGLDEGVHADFGSGRWEGRPIGIPYTVVGRRTKRSRVRVTVSRSHRAYVWPARHFASDDDDPSLPRMGERLRLKASADISGLPRQARRVARAMKLYGLIVARQRLGLVGLGRARPSLGRRPATRAGRAARARLRGRRHRPVTSPAP